jgi:hypothetical protein
VHSHNRSLALGLCLMFVLVAGVMAADEITMTGTVQPIAWDGSDNVFAAAIATKKGEEYIIAKDSMGKSLFQLAYKKVEVTGVVRENTRGEQIIKIRKYKVVPE